jgi:mannonate dehydratase
VVEMARRFASRSHFAHPRSVTLDADGLSFTEAPHLDGDADMVAVISELVAEDARRGPGAAPIPMRPDHGHVLLDDRARVTNPGYSLYGRMRGLAEPRGWSGRCGDEDRGRRARAWLWAIPVTLEQLVLKSPLHELALP